MAVQGKYIEKSIPGNDGSMTYVYTDGTSKTYAPKGGKTKDTSGRQSVKDLAQSIGETESNAYLKTQDVNDINSNAKIDFNQDEGSYFVNGKKFMNLDDATNESNEYSASKLAGAKLKADEILKSGKNGNNVWDQNNDTQSNFMDKDNYDTLLNNSMADGNDLTALQRQELMKYLDASTGTNAYMRGFLDKYGYEYNPNLSAEGNLEYVGIQDARNAEYQAKLNEIARQEKLAKQQAEEANRLAYIQQMLGKRDLSQQLASMGITGGASESALLQLASNYGNQVASNNQNLNNLLGEYGVQRNNAYAEKEKAIADALATLMGNKTTTTNAFDVDKALKTRSTLIEQGLDTSVIDKELEDNGYKVTTNPTNATNVPVTEETEEEPVEYTEEEYKQNFKDARSTILQMIKEDKSYDDLMGYIEEAKPYLTEKNYKYLINFVETRKNADTYSN